MKALPDRRGPRLIALGTLTFFSILFLIHAVEFGLWLRDPRRRLPVDGEKDGCITPGAILGGRTIASFGTGGISVKNVSRCQNPGASGG
ncbi:MAG: hypothetical protein IPQ26_09590 [Elusimicrobia bacterium]|nr:hypothetical protein [Elusimicrobiota bacterium]